MQQYLQFIFTEADPGFERRGGGTKFKVVYNVGLNNVGLCGGQSRPCIEKKVILTPNATQRASRIYELVLSENTFIVHAGHYICHTKNKNKIS